MLAAIYAHYSTDRQSETSPEDQARLCGERAVSLGLEVVGFFEDRAVSGGVPIASRAGGRSLLAGALAGDFEVILVEGLDRLSRDLVDQERVLRRLCERPNESWLGKSLTFNSDCSRRAGAGGEC